MLGVGIYCLFVAFLTTNNFGAQGDTIQNIALVLLLFVFSAAVTGALVFVYPAYLAINNKIKEALMVLGYTMLYFLALIIVGILLSI